MQSRKRIFLGLGSNVGDRLGNIMRAIEELRILGEIRAVSTIYESEPWGVSQQPTFLNCVVEMFTVLDPHKLLTEVKGIERRIGRKDRFRWGPREIDIDILLYSDEVIEKSDLKIPHPYIGERDFVLVPLLEIDSSLHNPETGRPFKEFLSNLNITIKPFCCLLMKRG